MCRCVSILQLVHMTVYFTVYKTNNLSPMLVPDAQLLDMMNNPSSGPQGNGIWPCQSTQQPGAPVWPSQPYQPCCPHQPNQANWPGMQPTAPNWPAYQPAPPTQSVWPCPASMGPNQLSQPISPSQTMPPSQPNQPMPPSQAIPPSWPSQLHNPIPPSWHGNPGQPGWPNQGPGVQQHPWPPVPPTGPVVSHWT